MKLLLMMLLMTFGAHAQKQIYNVQQYCIDDLPFKTNDCDVLGNEYSFVFVDAARKEVNLYLSDAKLSFVITSSESTAAGMVYSLKSASGLTQMTVNKAKTNITFNSAERNIRLKVGKSTKMT